MLGIGMGVECGMRDVNVCELRERERQMLDVAWKGKERLIWATQKKGVDTDPLGNALPLRYFGKTLHKKRLLAAQ